MSTLKEVAVVSGKGGTGKTTVSLSLAALMTEGVIVDADVDAPNMHILLQPAREETHLFKGGFVAKIEEELCTGCRRCQELCRFEAVVHREETNTCRVDPVACDGCGLCEIACPNGAVKMVEKEVGWWYRSNTRHGPFFHALLYPGEDNSGKLVTQIRTAAQEFAKKKGLKRILIDGPPGIGCPVISSLTGVEKALIVVEPTPSGLHDAERIFELTTTFQLKPYLLVNRFDVNEGLSEEIEEWCRKRGIEPVGRIPLDPNIPRLIREGRLPLESGGEIRTVFEEIYRKLFE